MSGKNTKNMYYRLEPVYEKSISCATLLVSPCGSWFDFNRMFGPQAMRSHIYIEQHCQNFSSIAEYFEFIDKYADIYLCLLVFSVGTISTVLICGVGSKSRWQIWSLLPHLPPVNFGGIKYRPIILPEQKQMYNT